MDMRLLVAEHGLQGLASAESASAFAAVPVATRKVSTFVSKMSLSNVSARAVYASAP